VSYQPYFISGIPLTYGLFNEKLNKIKYGNATITASGHRLFSSSAGKRDCNTQSRNFKQALCIQENQKAISLHQTKENLLSERDPHYWDYAWGV
jgi:hypothetical protein